MATQYRYVSFHPQIDDPLHVRLVAVGCGWSIAPAISEPFALKTKSMRPDRKKDFPVLSDSPKVLRKVGYAVYNHLQDREKIQSVKDILDRMDENGQSFEQRLLSELKTFSKDDFRDMMKVSMKYLARFLKLSCLLLDSTRLSSIQSNSIITRVPRR